MDRQLGKLFNHIRATPALRDNTLILVCSDNGPEPVPAAPVRFEEPRHDSTKGAFDPRWSSGPGADPARETRIEQYDVGLCSV